MRALLLALLFVTLCSSAAETRRIGRVIEYSGMSDASAGVALGSNIFVVANDEDNILRLYSTEHGGPPLKQYDLSRFLAQFDEADLEGAARIGNRIFWIGSHGENRRGKDRPGRRCFFATDIDSAGSVPNLTPVGRPCRTLLDDLLRDQRFTRFHLAEAASLAPKEPEALNIEGLSATPEGHLLLGFRNPVPGGKALLIPLLNPDEVITGAHSRFGDPIRLDLGGLGIRDIALCDTNYIIVGGPYHGSGRFHIYRWSGLGSEPLRFKIKDLSAFHPEGIVFYPDKGLAEIQFLSDDGRHLEDGAPGRSSADRPPQKFRSFWLLPEKS